MGAGRAHPSGVTRTPRPRRPSHRNLAGVVLVVVRRTLQRRAGARAHRRGTDRPTQPGQLPRRTLERQHVAAEPRVRRRRLVALFTRVTTPAGTAALGELVRELPELIGPRPRLTTRPTTPCVVTPDLTQPLLPTERIPRTLFVTARPTPAELTRPELTRPGLTEPTITDPTISRTTVTGPTVTGPAVTGATVTQTTITRITITGPAVPRAGLA
ncbi:hypothetical protein [Cryptosporangium sp. NPDC048952]|uniref:hypothetical protein n=1 Tax=Cryptosporangium sp. NPDC048952 TaxID=3363961 RepID=UPI0037237823